MPRLTRPLALLPCLILASISAHPQSPPTGALAPDLSDCMAKLHPGTEITLHAQGHGKVLVNDGGHYKNVDADTTTEMVRTVKSVTSEMVTFDVATLETVRISGSGEIYKQTPMRTQQMQPLHLEAFHFKKVGEEEVDALGRTFKTSVYAFAGP